MMRKKNVTRMLLLSIVFCLLVPFSAAAEYKDEYKMSVVVGSKLPWGQGAERCRSGCGFRKWCSPFSGWA